MHMLLYNLAGLEISKPIELKIPDKILRTGILHSEMKLSKPSLGSTTTSQNLKFTNRLCIDVFSSDAQENVLQDRYESRILFNPESFPLFKEKFMHQLAEETRFQALAQPVRGASGLEGTLHAAGDGQGTGTTPKHPSSNISKQN